jgi:DNA polymerase I
MQKILLIDTFNFLHRAYHALPSSFRDSKGEPVNAVYGVASMLINVLGLIRPDYAVAALDGMKPTFRVENFTQYKAHRAPMEENLSSQIPKVYEVLEAFGIKQILVDGYEADDIIGCVASRHAGDNLQVIIVSNDRDLWQLVNRNVLVMSPTTNGKVEWIGSDEVVKRMGFPPQLIPDYKGLRGDPSDNIPGVKGVGEKTAKLLIEEFGTVEQIYQNIGKVTPVSLKEKLLNNAEEAVMSKQLATIDCAVPVTFSLEDCKYSEYALEDIKEVLSRYNFKSLIRRLGLDVGNDVDQASSGQPNNDQIPLF